MPNIIKKSYQYFNLAFIIIVSSLYVVLTHNASNGQNLVFYGVGFITMGLMAFLLLFYEYKVGIMNKMSISLYLLVAAILPYSVILSKNSYMIILPIFIPLLLFNFIKQKKANYQFRVDNYYLINLSYLVSLILAVLLLLTKINYYTISLIFVGYTIYLDIIVLNKLAEFKCRTIHRRTYLSLLVLLSTFFLSFAGELLIPMGEQQSVISTNLIYPILAIVFLSISSKLQRNNLITLVNLSTTK